MKLFFVLLALAGPLFAQQRHEVCYKRTDVAAGTVLGQVCVTIPPAARQAVASFLNEPKQAKLYRGPADLVFGHLRVTLFAPLLERYPTAAMNSAEGDKASAETSRKAALDAALPPRPLNEP